MSLQKSIVVFVASTISFSIGSFAAGSPSAQRLETSHEAQTQETQQLKLQISSLEREIEFLRSELSDKDTRRPASVGKKPKNVALTHFGSKLKPIQTEESFVWEKLKSAETFYETGDHLACIDSLSSILTNYPSHPWAAFAQYRIGLSYEAYKQNELALREWNEVISKYPYSPWAADALAARAKLESKLGQLLSAKRTKEILQTLYPGSPAFHSLRDLALPAPTAQATHEPT